MQIRIEFTPSTVSASLVRGDVALWSPDRFLGGFKVELYSGTYSVTGLVPGGYLPPAFTDELSNKVRDMLEAYAAGVTGKKHSQWTKENE